MVQGREVVQQGVIPNNSKGLALLDKALHRRKLPLDKAIICCENTGIYTAPLLKWNTKKKYPLWVETPLAIKRGLGLVRGKDAVRIVFYAVRHQDQARQWQAPKEATEKIEALARMRTRILKQKQVLETPLKEIKQMEGMQSYKLALTCCKHTLAAIKKDLKAIEGKIQACIQADKELVNLYKILLSVPGVGPVLAVEFIVATDALGTSIRGKTRTIYDGG